MNQITEYKVVIGLSPLKLEEKVNELINLGWIPSGSMLIFPGQKPYGSLGFLNFEEINCFQAMVKLKDHDL